MWGTDLSCLCGKLVGRDIEITKCDLLFLEKYQEKQKVLVELLQAAGYDVPSPVLDV